MTLVRLDGSTHLVQDDLTGAFVGDCRMRSDGAWKRPMPEGLGLKAAKRRRAAS